MKLTELGQIIFEINDKPNIPLLSENAEIIEAETTELRKLIKEVQQEAIPSGTIVAYSKTVIPKGWAICDGKNGTPNLVDKFIMGTNLTNEITATSGKAEITLTTNQLPKHKHRAGLLVTDESEGHIHSLNGLMTNSTGSHSHTVTEMKEGTSWGYDGDHQIGAVVNSRTGTSGSHSHSITGSLEIDGQHKHKITGETDTTGANESINILPPYVKLFYIMKL